MRFGVDNSVVLEDYLNCVVERDRLDKTVFQYVEQEHDKEVSFLVRHPMSQSLVN